MPHRLSPSRINMFTECPLCFWMKVHEGMKRPGIFPSLPSGMDRVLKEHFDSFRREGGQPPELDDVDDVLFDDLEQLEEWRSATSYGLSWEDPDGNVLGGGIDDLLVSPDGKLVILDYKTRGYEPKESTHEHYRDQLALYTLVLQKLGHETEDYAYLLYYHPDHVNGDGNFVFHEHLQRMELDTGRAEELFRDAVACLEGGKPEPAEDCEWCEWRKEWA